jgi:hypothetical protein
MTTKKTEPQKTEAVRILAPDDKLKKKVGAKNIDNLFNKNKVEEAQKVTKAVQSEFLVEANDGIKEALEKIAESKIKISEITDLSFQIKSRAGVFGYDLASRVAKSLHDYLDEQISISNNMLTVLRSHLDILNYIFTKDASGDGGALAKEVLENLAKLKDKLPPTS